VRVPDRGRIGVVEASHKSLVAGRLAVTGGGRAETVHVRG